MIVGVSPTFWIGLDDTDEREFGCTTHDFNDLLLHIHSRGFTIKDPRLVRLWPFAPRRTRGNAALAASISANNSQDLESCLDDWFEKRFQKITIGEEKHSAQPVLMMTAERPPESIYWDTVTKFVDLHVRQLELESSPHRIWSTDAGQGGLIGASAAISWRGLDDYTWECTAWRVGMGPRHVPPAVVQQMSIKYPSTFLNRDPNAGKTLIAPKTPCPVLYGIRGESKNGVLEAHKFLQKSGVETSVSHRAHRSNQATDDHLDGAKSGIVKQINVMQGGHVEIHTHQKLLSFAEGGPVNKLSQTLQLDDEIEWFGLTDGEGSTHIEKLRLIRGKRNRMRPNCICGNRYKSQGNDQPLRCPKCGSNHENIWTYDIIESEWKEPPASHRRHLSKPLTRRGKSEG